MSLNDMLVPDRCPACGAHASVHTIAYADASDASEDLPIEAVTRTYQCDASIDVSKREGEVERRWLSGCTRSMEAA